MRLLRGLIQQPVKGQKVKVRLKTLEANDKKPYIYTSCDRYQHILTAVKLHRSLSTSTCNLQLAASVSDVKIVNNQLI